MARLSPRRRFPHHPSNGYDEQGARDGGDEERARGPHEERRHGLELLGVDVAADDAGDEIAERRGEEPDAHHLTTEFLRRQLGHRAETNWAQRELADRLQDVA